MTPAPANDDRIEQLEAENRELRQRLKDLETLVEFLPVGVGYADDPECRNVRINKEFAAILGLDVERNASKSGPDGDSLPFRAMQNGVEVPAEELPMQLAARDGRAYRDVELDIVRADGTVIRELCFAQPLFNERNEISGSLGAFLDITERRRIQDALRASEERYRFLAEAIPQIVWVSTIDYEILYINSHWASYSGDAIEQTNGRAWRDVVHPDDLRNVMHAATAGQQHGNYEAEYRLRRASDGEYRWHLGRARLLTMSDGSRRWLGTATDIHDRKQASQQLAAALDREFSLRKQAEDALDHQQRIEQQLLLLVEASGTLITTPDSALVLGKIMNLAQRFVGADAYAIWRKTDNSTVWQVVADYGLSEAYSRVAIEHAPASSILASHPLAVEDVLTTPSLAERRSFYEQESIRSMLVVPLSIRGELQGTISFYYREPHRFNDLETRVAGGLANLAAASLGNAELYEKQSQLRLHAEAAERRSNFLAEAGRVLSSSLDIETTLASVANLAVPAIADWATVQVLDDSGALKRVALKHIDPRKIEMAREYTERYPQGENSAVMKALRTGTSILVREIPHELFSERVRDSEQLAMLRQLGLASVIIVPLVAAGNTLGVLTFVTESGRHFDDSDLMLAEELAGRAATAISHAHVYRELERANTELKRVNEDLNQFAYSASHDLKEPLRMIAIYSQLLQTRYASALEGQARTFLDYVVHGAKRMDMLIRDILAYTQTADMSDEGPARSSASEALTKALENLHAAIRETGADITRCPLPELQVQEIHLVQLFQNLIGNAIKYRSDAAPRINIAARKDGDLWKISIADNGIGIAPEYSERIFGIFTRLHPAGKYSGTGIGLAICQKIVQRYGGEIKVESEECKGATFWFTLPG
jgi:PAS domain S-box-containing protein